MPDSFDDARRALDEVPVPDLWDDAQRRAADGAVPPLEPVAGRTRHPGRWLAVAAAAVVVAGTVAVLVDDDSQSVQVGASTDRAVVPLMPPTADFAPDAGRCGFALDGPGPYTPHEAAEDSGDGQPEQQRRVSVSLGQQEATIAVPGMVLIDLVGERVEEVGLERGAAQVWFSTDFVQVRWFTGSQDPCDSFTVTVSGSTEDGNRHAAVDLAEHVLLPAELDAALRRTLEGRWQLEEARLDGEPVDGDALEFSFLDGEAGWNDGCNPQGGAYEITSATSIRLPEGAMGNLKGCPTDLTMTAIARVMKAPDIAVSTTDDALVLTDVRDNQGATDLRLRPVGSGDPTPPGGSLAGTEWQLERSTVDGVPTDGNGSTFTFTDSVLSWSDGCNSFSGTYEAEDATVLRTVDVTSSAVSCPPGATNDAISSVMGAAVIQVSRDGNLLILTAGDTVLILRRIAGDDTTVTTGDPAVGGVDDYTFHRDGAIWPETAARQAPGVTSGGNLDHLQWRSSGADTAIEFGRQILGWEDARVVAGQREPSEDGRSGELHLLESPASGAQVEIRVAPTVYGRWFSVYGVELPTTVGSVPVSVTGREVLATPGTQPAGAVSATARFDYGGRVAEGPAGEALTLGFDPDTTGSVLVLYWDESDRIIAAWGIPVPAGDFAAG